MAKSIQALVKIADYLCQAARLMVGISDYNTYVCHRQLHHPGQPIMTYKAFFRDRQAARYGGKGPGCCC